MSFPAYPGYKHSGVELLGELPEHWTLKRFKNVFEERAERSADGLEELLSVSAYFGIKPRSESRDEGDHLSRAESLEGYKVCHPGDLVINIMLAWNRGLGFSWQSGIVSPAYCVF
ncbi:restriction endonuclease subunit S, partial [Pseudomonas sp. MWU12-2534b]